jgi:hypothetical protein
MALCLCNFTNGKSKTKKKYINGIAFAVLTEKKEDIYLVQHTTILSLCCHNKEMLMIISVPVPDWL